MSPVAAPAAAAAVDDAGARALAALAAPATWAAVTALCEATYPREACGWIDDAGVRPAAPGDRERFAFADDDLLALAAASRGPRRPRLLFHAHPDGDLALSDADRAALAPGGVVLHPLPHLIVAVAGGRAHAAAVHVLAPAPTVLARYRRASTTRPAAAGPEWRPW